MDGDGLESGGVPSINEFFASENKAPNGAIVTEVIGNLPLVMDGPPTSSAIKLPPITTQNIASTSQSVTPVTPTSSNGQKSAPYYGRMQTVRAPLPGENRQVSGSGAYAKSLNSHVGTIRWELDPLYIAP